MQILLYKLIWIHSNTINSIPNLTVLHCPAYNYYTGHVQELCIELVMDMRRVKQHKDQVRDWSSLPGGLVEKISDNLCLYDYLCFSNVCKSWRSYQEETLQLHCNRSSGFPCLVMSKETESETACCISLLEKNKLLQLEMPTSSGGLFLGCIKDWLIIVKPFIKFSITRMLLLNPFTGSKVDLPNTFSVNSKVVFSGDPEEEEDEKEEGGGDRSEEQHEKEEEVEGDLKLMSLLRQRRRRSDEGAATKKKTSSGSDEEKDEQRRRRRPVPAAKKKSSSGEEEEQLRRRRAAPAKKKIRRRRRKRRRRTSAEEEQSDEEEVQLRRRRRPAPAKKNSSYGEEEEEDQTKNEKEKKKICRRSTTAKKKIGT
ncbi:hypothetical protein Dsin_012130 [Dipteronia sinensis]|uniref:F-box domain-containing protein n=1 Tax=Dipteronia sinensis TaxID=43782 RepID=A0AAE0AIB6_9ROSI|nr:hypothetical protein Dsin_012130 [Dipteronia sinensis]